MPGPRSGPGGGESGREAHGEGRRAEPVKQLGVQRPREGFRQRRRILRVLGARHGASGLGAGLASQLGTEPRHVDFFLLFAFFFNVPGSDP